MRQRVFGDVALRVAAAEDVGGLWIEGCVQGFGVLPCLPLASWQRGALLAFAQGVVAMTLCLALCGRHL